MISVTTLKKHFKTFTQAKAHFQLKATSWADLAHQLNQHASSASLPESLAPAPLIEALQAKEKNAKAVFCTPGHKLGQSIPNSLGKLIGPHPFRTDLPDLPGLNLYESDSAIASAQSLAAKTFGADQTWFLINGSTVGVMAAILATCGPSDKILLPRNSHTSAIAGLILSGAQPIFLRPDYDPQWDLAHCITPQSVATALEHYPEIKAILMVSPTYHGVCGDVRAIAALAHQHNIPLIVDEAHGAHFSFHPDLPTSALAAGADLVVQSTHKTLSALTQSSMLHLKGDRVDAPRITQVLQLLQSSSPSNLLLASLDGVRQQMADQGEVLMSQTIQLSHQARKRVQQIGGLSVLQPEQATTPGFCQLDLTRLTIDISRLGIDGFTADKILSQQFGVIAELPTQRQLTFIFTSGNSALDLDRLLDGLRHLAQLVSPQGAEFHGMAPPITDETDLPCLSMPARSPRDAFWGFQETVSIANAVGRISAETLCPYPPGIPLILPGEVITKTAIAQLQQIQTGGGLISGCTDPSLQQLTVWRD